MADPSSASADRPDDGADGDREGSSADAADVSASGGADEVESLRREVEEKYDFENFGPAQMREMSADEWEAVFDADSWIVGRDLLDRVEADLKNRIATRDVFAVLEWYVEDGEDRLLAYSDEGYAIVYPDGSVEGEGTVLRDVKPTVALCSMEDYEVDEPPANVSLPRPGEVPEGTGEFGNLMLQVVAGVQLLAGVGLFVAWGARLVTTIVAPVVALAFIGIGLFLFMVVANARLSDRFRAEEYRNRLRAIGLDDGERPDFLPVDPDDLDANARRDDRRDPSGR
jgi:hypothetical protein